MPILGSPTYRFGPYRYDSGQRLLFRGDQLVPLAPKLADTLQVLFECQGKIVEKRELLRRVWPDTTVEEVGLARNISQLRKTLGGDSESAEFIETLPKRGYRFVGVTQVLEHGGQSLDRGAGIRRALRKHSRIPLAAAVLLVLLFMVYWQFYRSSRYLSSAEGVANMAVVPFECLSPELNCYTFPRGLNDLLVARLSGLNSLHVLSPSTVYRYQRARLSMAFMARILNMDATLEGSIQKIGDQVRITARLVDVHNAKVIWAGTCEYPAAQLGEAQDRAARQIAAQVAAHLAVHGRFWTGDH